MDDVDRLFQCFKCGVSPPQSAVRDRKTSTSRLKQELQGTESSGFPGQEKKKTRDLHISSERLGSATDKTNKLNSGKRISPVVFYGSPHGVPPKRPSSLLRLLREIHIDLAGRRKSNLREQIWATFPKQDEAIKFTEQQANARIFSYQDHFNGQRRFLVSTYQEFWKRYNNMDSKLRHHYEVIQEGLPCHLYFDLEFSWTENRDKDGNQMVDLLVLVIFEALYEKYQMHGEKDWIVELDSSTEAKFSRHLVLRIPKAAFKDNSHAGAFVSELCSRIHSAREKDARFQQLFVSKDSSSSEPSLQLFIDNAVYSRNRCFRLALSSKAGKTSVLLPSGCFKCRDMVNFANSNRSSIRGFPFSVSRNDVSCTHITGKSPFPALDMYIESVASIGNVTGKIRGWYWFSEDGLMVYSMSRNRYCERIGREHKSNHVMYVVDLQWALYYQKCYDPDCRGYRSPSRPLPDDLIPEISSLSHIGDVERSAENKLELANIDQEYIALDGDESMTDRDGDDVWWLEAAKVADDVENMGNLSFTSKDNASEDDDEWWIEVERTASHAELNRHGWNLKGIVDY